MKKEIVRGWVEGDDTKKDGKEILKNLKDN